VLLGHSDVDDHDLHQVLTAAAGDPQPHLRVAHAAPWTLSCASQSATRVAIASQVAWTQTLFESRTNPVPCYLAESAITVGLVLQSTECQGAVAREVGEDNVQVNVNNDRYMTIGIINSPLRSLPDDQRRAKALQIAQLAFKTYPSRASLETVGVAFVVHRSYFFFNVNDGRDYFAFSTAELAEPPGRGTELFMPKGEPPNDQMTAPASLKRRS
jgi:hypothetical protein